MKHLIPTVAFVLVSAAPATAQINAYAKVTAISGSTLTLSDVNQTYHTFAKGEEVVVMQMQDTVIGKDTAHSSSFGTVSDIANAGIYEVDTIKSVSATSIVLTAPPTGTYNVGPKGAVQVISFQALSTGNYTINNDITAVSWNGNVGGVIAIQVGGTLTLEGNIVADAQGFRGGSLNNNYEVDCEPNVYDTTSANYGYKGEGIYATTTINYTNQTGRAPLINGGGGGSDDNGGGGGGSNYSAGGQGGYGWTCTSSNQTGGLGGNTLGSYISGSRVFMGGGGGSGQQNNSVGSAGAKGGGIVLIKATAIKTKCSGGATGITISAEGGSASNSQNDGAGGGGAGGTVVLNVSSFSATGGCPLFVEADGGTGGSVNYDENHGGGGGGGQGAVIYTINPPTSNVTTSTNIGAGGASSTLSGAPTGASGSGTANTGIIQGITPLPVGFIYFDAAKQDKGNLLTWETGALYQHTLFNVQRSDDGAHYATIGTITGEAGPSGTNDFSFVDASPVSGNNFYRIEEVDPSGQATNSDVALIAEEEIDGTFTLFPNPSPGEFFIRLPGTPMAGSYTVSVIDMTGRAVFTTAPTLSGNLLTITPDHYLPSGIYVVRVQGGGQVLTGKLMVKGA